MTDTLTLAGHEFRSRFILGSGKYSYDLIDSAINHADAEIITMALRQTDASQENILDFIPENVTLLPNTSGCQTVAETVRIARLARELSGSRFIKLEVIPDKKYLMPDNVATLEATRILAAEGFIVLPYILPDLVIAQQLVAAGAAAIMPLAAPIGSNGGLANKALIQLLVDNIDVPIIVDAGIGKPSQAAEAMEMGVDAIMANTGIASAGDIPLMAEAFKLGIQAGRAAYLAKPGVVRGLQASPSSPVTGISQSTAQKGAQQL